MRVELSDLQVALLFQGYNKPVPPVVEGALQGLKRRERTSASESMFEHLRSEGLVVPEGAASRFEPTFEALLYTAFNMEAMANIEHVTKMMATVYQGQGRATMVSRVNDDRVELSSHSLQDAGIVLASLHGVVQPTAKAGVTSIIDGHINADRLLGAFQNGETDVVAKICDENDWHKETVEELLSRMDFPTRWEECRQIMSIRADVDGMMVSQSYYAEGFFWVVKTIVIGKNTKNIAFAQVGIDDYLDYITDFKR